MNAEPPAAQPVPEVPRARAGAWRSQFRRRKEEPMAAYPVSGRAAPWPRSALRAALVPALALSDLLLSPGSGRPGRPYRADGWGVPGDAESRLGRGRASLPQGANLSLPISVWVTAAVGLAAASVLVKYEPRELGRGPASRRAGSPGGFCNIGWDPANGLMRFNVLSRGGAGRGRPVRPGLRRRPRRRRVPPSQVTPLMESIADVQGNTMNSSIRAAR